MDSAMTGLQQEPSRAFIATAAEKERFNALWSSHLKLRDDGTIAYFMPNIMARQLNGKEGMIAIAKNLSELREGDVYVYYDIDNAAYRIGDYVEPCDQYTFVAKIKYGGPPGAELGLAAPCMVPKPSNSWILYRRDKWAELKLRHPHIHTSVVSKLVSKMWRKESPAIKKRYTDRAAQLKAAHLRAHPNYKCTPRKSSAIKRRNTKQKQVSSKNMSTTPAQTSETTDDSDVSGGIDTSDEADATSDSDDESIEDSMDESVDDSVHNSVNESADESDDESADESADESDDESADESADESDDESDDERPPLDLNNPNTRAIIEQVRKDWNDYFGPK